MLVKYVLLQLKQKDYDGVRIMVDIINVNAINLYSKLGFFNCGEVDRFDQRYYLLELRLYETIKFLRLKWLLRGGVVRCRVE